MLTFKVYDTAKEKELVLYVIYMAWFGFATIIATIEFITSFLNDCGTL